MSVVPAANLPAAWVSSAIILSKQNRIQLA